MKKTLELLEGFIPVFTFRYDDIRRINYLTEMLDYFSGIFANNVEIFEKTIFLITFVPQTTGSLDAIKDKVEEFFDDLSERTDISDGAVSIAENYEPSRAIFFQPLNEKCVKSARKLITKLVRKPATFDCNQVSMPPITRKALVNKLKDVKLDVEKWAKEGNTKNIIDIFFLLEELSKSLDFIKHYFDECKRLVNSLIKNRQNKVIARFEEILDIINLWSAEEGCKINEFHQYLHLISPLKKYLDSDILSHHDFGEYILSQISQFFDQACKTTDFMEMKLYRKKLVNFSEDIKVDQVISDYVKKYDLFVTRSANDFWQQIEQFRFPITKEIDSIFKSFDLFCSLVGEWNIISETIGSFINKFSHDASSSYNTMKDLLNEQSNEFIKSLSTIVAGSDLTSLQCKFSVLKAAKNHTKLQDLIGVNEAKKPFDNAKQIGVQIGTQLIETIKNQFQEDKTRVVRQIIEPIRLICEIDDELNTDLYHPLFNFFTILQTNVDKTLQKLEEELSLPKPNYTALHNYYREIKSNLWLDDFKANSGRSALKLQEANKSILYRIIEITSEMKKIWSAENYEASLRAIITLDNLQKFAQYDQEIRKQLESARNFYCDAISKFMKEINSLCEDSNTTKPIFDNSNDGNLVDKLPFAKIENFLIQLADIQDVAENLGFKRKYADTKNFLQQVIENKLRNLQIVITQMSGAIDYRVAVRVLEKLEPPSYFDPESELLGKMETAYQYCKKIIYQSLEHLISECELNLEQENLDEANENLTKILSAKTLNRFFIDNDISITSEIMKIQRKCLSKSKIKCIINKIPQLIRDLQFAELSMSLNLLADKERAQTAFKQEIANINLETDNLVSNFESIVNGNFNTRHFKDITDKILILSNCIEFGFDFIKSEQLQKNIDDKFYNLDDNVVDAVNFGLKQLKNGRLEEGSKIIRDIRKYLRNCPQNKKYFAHSYTVIKNFETEHEKTVTTMSTSPWSTLNDQYKRLEKDQDHLKSTIRDTVIKKTNECCSKALEKGCTQEIESLELQIKNNLTESDLIEPAMNFIQLAKKKLKNTIIYNFQNALASNNIESVTTIYQKAIKDGDYETENYFQQVLFTEKTLFENGLQTAIENNSYDDISRIVNAYQKFSKCNSNIFTDVSGLPCIDKLRMDMNTKVTNLKEYSDYEITNEFPNTYVCSVISIIKIFSIPNLGAVERKSIVVITKPVVTILKQIDEFITKGKAQYDFYILYQACEKTESFSSLIEELKKLDLTNDELTELRMEIERANSFPIYCRNIKSFLEKVSDECVNAWSKNKDASVMEKVLSSICNGHLAKLSKYVSSAKQIEVEIKQNCTAIYSSLINETNTSLKLSNASLTQNLADLQKLSIVENLLGKSGSASIVEKITSQIDRIKANALNASEPKEITASLISLQQFADEVPFVEEKVKKSITEVLSKHEESIDVLEGILKQYESRMGNILIDTYPQFIANRDKQMQKTIGETIDKAAHEFKISDDDYDLKKSCSIAKHLNYFGPTENQKIISQYDTFEKKFKEIVHENAGAPNYDLIVRSTKDICSPKKRNLHVPHALAHVMAVWSLIKSNVTTTKLRQTEGKREYWYKPHAVQMLTLFRMLELKNGKFFNQLVQVLTGEGKSVILGTLSCIFALKGYDVNCICYSSYLSARDYDDFKEIFQTFKVDKFITYSTINEMSEMIIDKRCNVRELVDDYLGDNLSSSRSKVQSSRPSILLIDEVDVFFGIDFYGSTYNPGTRIQNNDTFELMKAIWKNQSVDIGTINKLPCCANLIQKYPNWEALIQQETSKMLIDVKNWNKEKPIVFKNKVAYVIHGNISTSTAFGYKTAFAYFHFLDKGEISEQSVRENIGINIICGIFSYAEIPQMFDHIMGVSGTLSNLTNVEKEILSSFGINRVAVAPSMYGDSRRSFATKSDVKLIKDIDNWYLSIVQSAKDKVEAGRAVIIIFGEDIKRAQFIDKYKSIFENFQILEEKSEFKKNIIEKATKSGMVTIISRSFARGTDFSIKDSTTISKGGVHVIQTFISESAAEHIQAEGRCARQGEQGSFEMKLLLEEVLNRGLSKEKIAHGVKTSTLYDEIVAARDKDYEQSIQGLIEKEKDASSSHATTMKFHGVLVNYNGTPEDSKTVQNSILAFNLSYSKPVLTHFYFCLDDSTSDWNSLINTVIAFINRRIEMYKNYGIPYQDKVTTVNYSSNAQDMCGGVDINDNPEKQTRFRGGADIAVGLNLVAAQMRNCESNYKPVLVFMSDGSNGDAEIKQISTEFAPNVKIFVLGIGCCTTN